MKTARVNPVKTARVKIKSTRPGHPLVGRDLRATMVVEGKEYILPVLELTLKCTGRDEMVVANMVVDVSELDIEVDADVTVPGLDITIDGPGAE